jgi:hypothetical protein
MPTEVLEAAAAGSASVTTESSADPLAGYTGLASQLRNAYDAVKSCRDEVSSLVMIRDAQASRRRELLANVIRVQDEASVDELAKLSARGEVYSSKIEELSARLRESQQTLQEVFLRGLAGFIGLSGSLHAWLLARTEKTVLEPLIPEVHAQFGGIGSFAKAMSEWGREVRDFQIVMIRSHPQPPWSEPNFPPTGWELESERLCEKIPPLMNAVMRYSEQGFVPPSI